MLTCSSTWNTSHGVRPDEISGSGPFLDDVHESAKAPMLDRSQIGKSVVAAVGSKRYFIHIYHSCSLMSERTTRCALTNTSVLTWRSGIHVHDAHAKPLVVPRLRTGGY